MSGNSFGRAFTLTTFGESHGPALGGVVDGCPPGLPLEEADLQRDVDRRRPGTSRFTSQRRETDRVRILSGVFEGRTTGTPIGVVVENEDQRSYDYEKIRDRFRPGHADYTYQQKYGMRDHRGGGRSSARETVIRVAGGAIARKYLRERLGVTIHGWLAQAGPLRFALADLDAADRNPFFCPDPSRIAELEELINRLRSVNRVVAPVELKAPLRSMEVRACSLTPERLARLRAADAVVRRLSHESGYDHEVWQFPVILIPLGTAAAPDSVVLRPIHSVDGMTAQSVPMPDELLCRMCTAILDIAGIAGVFYDLTHKPPGTIEWE